MLYEYPQKKVLTTFALNIYLLKDKNRFFLYLLDRFKHVYRNSTTILNKGIRGSLDLPKIGIGIKILEMGPSY